MLDGDISFFEMLFVGHILEKKDSWECATKKAPSNWSGHEAN